MRGIRELLDGKYGNGIKVSDGNGMGMEMKSLKWEGIGTKNLFPHTSRGNPFVYVSPIFVYLVGFWRSLVFENLYFTRMNTSGSKTNGNNKLTSR